MAEVRFIAKTVKTYILTLDEGEMNNLIYALAVSTGTRSRNDGDLVVLHDTLRKAL